MKELLVLRNARLYLGGQLVSLFGDSALWLAMGIWVKTLTGSSSAAGLVFFAFGLPQLFSPISGVFVDRFARKPLLIVTNLVLGLIVLSLFLVHGRSDIWIIYAVMVLYGLSYNVISAAGQAFLSTMIPAELLGHANGALSTAREGLRLLAPLAGAALFVAVGGGWIAAIDAATFFLAALSLLFIKVDEPKPQPSELHWLDEASAGARHIFSTVILRQVTIATMITVIVVGFTETLVFAVVSQGLHRSPAFLGVLLAIQGVGGLVGGLTAASLMQRTGEGVLCGIGLAAVAIASPLLASSTLAVVIVTMSIFGLGIPWVIVGITTVFQRMTPASIQGRTFAALDVLIGFPQTLSIGLGALLVAVVDYRLMLFAMGAVTGIACLYLLTRRQQWERRQESGAPEPSPDASVPASPEPAAARV